MSTHDGAFEALVQEQGMALLADAGRLAKEQSAADHWVRELLQRINSDPDFRIRALRFVDVLPTLEDDADLVGVFNEYFAEHSFPLPRFGSFAMQAGRLLGDRALASLIRGAAETLSRRFMAGNETEDVLALRAKIADTGRLVSLDRVGEVTLSEAEADRYLQSYLALIDAAGSASGPALQMSVKLSSLCSRHAPQAIEHSVAALMPRLFRLARAARDTGAGITLDMEDYDKRPLILAAFEQLVLDAEFADWPDVGIAVQAYLRDAERDVGRLIALAVRRGVAFHVRLVRGAYWDQECVHAAQQGWPVPVWSQKAQTDACFESCIDRLLSAHPQLQLAVATHNPRSLAYAMVRARQLGLGKDAVEFQMLFGMLEALQEAVAHAGYGLRVYLPFGHPIPGMAYLVRRLLENASSQSLARWFDADSAGDARLLQRLQPSPAEAEGPERASFANEPPRRFVDDRERAVFASAIERVRAQFGASYRPLIDGQPVNGGETLTSVCPADPSLIVGEVATAGQAQAEMAIEAAGRAFPDWRRRSGAERAGLLRDVADRLRDARHELAAWEVFEAGKNWAEADADVCEAIDFLNYYADEAERLLDPRGRSLAGEDNRYTYQARGIGVVIPPWNFPLAILVGMLSATIVSGNCAILKPSSDTPVIAARFIRLLLDAGVPPGVVGYLPGPGRAVGEYLVDHPHTHLVAFTGSREVGCHLLQRAAVVHPGQRHVKRVIAEMGGKNAIIVDASADPDEAIAGILQSAFGFQGQKCSACSRVIVVGGLYDVLLERLCEATASLVMDLPWCPHCDLGPVINTAAQQRIEGMIEGARGAARLAYRGSVPEGLRGHFVAPAVFADVEPGSGLAQEEIFGPVLAVMRSADFDSALAIANDTDYALTGGVYSRSPANLQRAAEAFHVGNLYLNRGITGALVARQPFGGFRMSGIGSKAGGPDYLLQFMEPRCVTENTLRRGMAPGISQH